MMEACLRVVTSISLLRTDIADLEADTGQPFTDISSLKTRLFPKKY
jgi:hypothetical protein